MEAILISLPAELLVCQILPFLSLKDLVILDSANCQKACRLEWNKRLHGVTHVGSLSQQLNLFTLKWLSQRHMSLENIRLGNTGDSTDKSLIAQCGAAFAKTKNCRIKSTVDYWWNIPTVHNLALLAHCWHTLEYLDLSFCIDVNIGCLFSHCASLHTLELKFCTSVVDSDIATLTRSCLQLRSLNLSLCSRITDTTLVLLSRNCSGLVRLNISGTKSATDDGIKALAQGCQLLEVLEMESCEEVGDAGLISLVTNCTALHTLNLGECSAITSVGFIMMAQKLNAAFKNLDVSRCRISEQFILFLAAQCPCLLSLTVTHCCISAAPLVYLAQQCTQLKDLGLSTMFTILHHEATLVSLIEQCTNLESLDLSRCFALTDAAVVQISVSCTQLKYLDLSEPFNGITDHSIQSIAHKCKQLVSLKVFGCKYITVESMTSVVMCCPKLNFLHFGCSMRLSDHDVGAFYEMVRSVFPNIVVV